MIENTLIRQIEDWFKTYSESFCSGDKSLVHNIRLKINHTYKVVDAAEKLADALKLEGRQRQLAILCSLLHDCGRFEQFKKYGTYMDIKSEDHGALGVKVLKQEGVLERLEEKDRDVIYTAVAHHNAKIVPGGLTPEQLFFTELTRDADKIDIYRVLSEYYGDNNPDKDQSVTFFLPEADDICDAVFNEYTETGRISFKNLQSVQDFVFVQLSWIKDLNHRESLRIIHRSGYLDDIAAKLPDTQRGFRVREDCLGVFESIENEKHLTWTENSREEMVDCKIFKIHTSMRTSSDKNVSRAYLLEAPGWVTVIPVIEKADGKYFLMVRQYRHGSKEITTEFPAGTVEPGEEPESSAARELLEETGYSSDKLTWLGSVNPNPAFFMNKFTVFLAEELVHRGGQELDETEFVDFDLVPAETVINRMGSSEYGNGTMMIALAYYLRAEGRLGGD